MKTTIRLVHNKFKRLKDGKAAIYIEVAFSREKRRFINTKITVEPSDWNKRKREIYSKYESAAATNKHLRDKVTEILNYEIELLNKGKFLTPDLLDKFIDGKSANTKEFYKFALDEFNKESMAVETYKKNKSILEKLDNHSPNLTFSDITFNYVKDVDNWLNKSTKISSINTIANYHKMIKKYVRLAINMGYMKYEQNPYNQFKVKKTETTRTNLTDAELEAFKSCVFKKDNTQLIQDMFVFSCYTGLRYSDIINLQQKHFDIQENEVTISINKMIKTQKPVELPLHMLFGGRPLEIFKKYYKEENQYLFGIPLTNQFMNRELKVIAKKAEIDYKDITFHMARHTFGSLLAEKTGDPYLIKDLMGHSEIKMSMGYIHSSRKAKNDKLMKIEW